MDENEKKVVYKELISKMVDDATLEQLRVIHQFIKGLFG